MEQENISIEEPEVVKTSKLNTVTPLSKYLAMALFIILPFVGGWIGYTYAPEKVAEKEQIIEKKVEVEKVVLPKIIIENQTSDENTPLDELEGYLKEYSTEASVRLILEKDYKFDSATYPACSFKLQDTETGEVIINLQQAYWNHIGETGPISNSGSGSVSLIATRYISTDTGKVFFSTGIPESGSCCNTTVYDVQTGLFDTNFDHFLQHSDMIYTESGFLVFPADDGSQITVYDLENDMEVVQEISITDGTVIEEPCGMISIGYNLTDVDNGRIIYGVHKEEGEASCHTRELIEYRAFELPSR